VATAGATGIYRRGSKYVGVYRVEGRQRKQYAGTLAQARAMKLECEGEARALRRGPTLHGFSLSWLDRYAGSGHDSVRANTRREYRRLLVNFAPAKTLASRCKAVTGCGLFGLSRLNRLAFGAGSQPPLPPVPDGRPKARVRSRPFTDRRDAQRR
jgi:hypothetical protein